MKDLPGSVPARLKKLKAMLQRVVVSSDAGTQDAVAKLELPAFEAWWGAEGQYGRGGGGDYEKTFAFNAWAQSSIVTACGKREWKPPSVQPTLPRTTLP